MLVPFFLYLLRLKIFRKRPVHCKTKLVGKGTPSRVTKACRELLILFIWGFEKV
jgi:hypothetical protein